MLTSIYRKAGKVPPSELIMDWDIIDESKFDFSGPTASVSEGITDQAVMTTDILYAIYLPDSPDSPEAILSSATSIGGR